MVNRPKPYGSGSTPYGYRAPVAQWIEQSPSKTKIEVRLPAGAQRNIPIFRDKRCWDVKFWKNLYVPQIKINYGDRGVAATLGFVEPSSRVQIPSIAQGQIIIL